MRFTSTCEKIRILKGSDRVRLRPTVIFSSSELEGAKTALEMMLSDMTAECGAGNSDRVIITLYDDSSIEIEDFGKIETKGSTYHEKDTSLILAITLILGCVPHVFAAEGNYAMVEKLLCVDNVVNSFLLTYILDC